MAKRITVRKARDKSGVLPGFFVVNLPRGSIKVAGKRRATEIAEASRRLRAKRRG